MLAAEFGKDTDVVIGDEDAQPLEVPIVAPVKTKRFALTESDLPQTNFEFAYVSVAFAVFSSPILMAACSVSLPA